MLHTIYYMLYTMVRIPYILYHIQCTIHYLPYNMCWCISYDIILTAFCRLQAPYLNPEFQNPHPASRNPKPCTPTPKPETRN